MQESGNETENEVELADFRQKYNRRMAIIVFISGLLIIIISIWGIIYYQGETDGFSFLIVNLILGCFFCALALMSPSIDKWLVSRSNHILLPPAGWDQFAMAILWVLMTFWEGKMEVHYLPSNWTSDPQGFISAIFYFAMMCSFCFIAFLCELPQARRSVYLSLRIYSREPVGQKRHSFPMDCWRAERFDTIIKRLCNKRKFKRRFAHLLIPPNSRINLVYHDKILMPESTPAQEGIRFYARVTVTLGERNV